MHTPKPLRFALFALLFLAGQVLAQANFNQEAVKSLAGRNVLLLVGSPDQIKAQKAMYLDLVERAGADVARYPVYATSKLPNEVAGKLGLVNRGSNYAALVKWGNPARFGPARVLETGVTTKLTGEADLFVVVADAFEVNRDTALLEKLPADLQALRPRAELTVEKIDFQANGKPLYLVDTKVRIRNGGKLPAKGVVVHFQVENPDGTWYELGRHEDLEIKAGDTITRDLVRTTHDTPLLNDKNEIQPTRYRITVDYDGHTIDRTEEFQPALLIDQK